MYLLCEYKILNTKKHKRWVLSVLYCDIYDNFNNFLQVIASGSNNICIHLDIHIISIKAEDIT